MSRTQVKTKPPPAAKAPSGPKSSEKPAKLSLQRRRSGRSETVHLPRTPALRFSPAAWAKLLYFRDRGQTEIGGFGIAPAEDLLYVEELVTVDQEVSVATVSFDDEAVANFFEDQVALGRKPEQFARIWCHTHPGESPTPSLTDVETFERVFGGCDWAVMFIVGRTGKTHAELRFNIGPGGQMLIPVEVSFDRPFVASDEAAWGAEFKANIHPTVWHAGLEAYTEVGDCLDTDDLLTGHQWLEQFELLDPDEREAVVDQLSDRPDFWDDQDEEDWP